MATPPLNTYVRIANSDGTPTPEFLRAWQNQRDTNTTIPSLSTAAEVSAVLDVLGSAQGAILYRTASTWALLAPGTSGQYLKSNGTAPPSWASVAAAGSFLALSDTPSAYTGQAGKVPTVNAGETGLEFTAAAGGGFTPFNQYFVRPPLAAPFASTAYGSAPTLTDGTNYLTVNAGGVAGAAYKASGAFDNLTFCMENTGTGANLDSGVMILGSSGASITYGVGTDASGNKVLRGLRWNAAGAYVNYFGTNNLFTDGSSKMWLRLVVSTNNNIEAWYSNDGVTWALQGRVALSLIGGSVTGVGFRASGSYNCRYAFWRDVTDEYTAGGGGGGGSTTFTGLTDTPAAFTGAGGKHLVVNAGETAVEFVDAQPVGAGAMYTNAQSITTNYIVAATDNAGSFGPVSVSAGATVTVSAGSRWSVV